MNPKKVAYLLMLAGALAMGACGDDGTTTPEMDGGTEEMDAGTMEPMPLPIEANDGEGNYFMAASSVGLALPMAGMVSPGFDLDNTVSDGTDDAADCDTADYMTASGEMGIDNAFGEVLNDLLSTPTIANMIIPLVQEYFPGRNFEDDPFVPEDINVLVQNFIATGEQIVIFEVKGADSTEDSDVVVNLLFGQLPEGATIMVGADGKLTAGQTFDVDSDSFTDGVAGTMPVATFNARITGGEFRVGPLNIDPAAFGLDITSLLSGFGDGLGDAGLEIELIDAQMGARFTTTGLTDGRIAGALDLGELRRGLCAAGVYGTDAEDQTFMDKCPADITPPAEPALDADVLPIVSLIITVVENAADIIDTESPANPPLEDRNCERLSIGLTFEAVPATRGTIVDDNAEPAAM